MRKEKGQSLIEVILALSVVVIILVGLIRVAVVSMRNARYARDEAQATQYAQQSIEEARRLRDEQGNDFFVDSSCNDGPETIDVIFTRERDCNLDGSNMEVMVTVGWEEGGQDKEVVLETVLTPWR